MICLQVTVKGTFTAPKSTFWIGAPGADGSTDWWKEKTTLASAPRVNRFHIAVWDGFLNSAKACQANAVRTLVVLLATDFASALELHVLRHASSLLG